MITTKKHTHHYMTLDMAIEHAKELYRVFLPDRNLSNLNPVEEREIFQMASEWLKANRHSRMSMTIDEAKDSIKSFFQSWFY